MALLARGTLTISTLIIISILTIRTYRVQTRPSSPPGAAMPRPMKAMLRRARATTLAINITKMLCKLSPSLHFYMVRNRVRGNLGCDRQ